MGALPGGHTTDVVVCLHVCVLQALRRIMCTKDKDVRTNARPRIINNTHTCAHTHKHVCMRDATYLEGVRTRRLRRGLVA
jgi:hypothetical protein